MATAFDVARYILVKQGPMSAMKLHKLLYYCQAWSLVWDEAPMFGERIEAWANGPVVRDVYRVHRGHFGIHRDGTIGDRLRLEGNPDALSVAERETADLVLEFYGDKDPQWLSDLTHMEAPWQNARRGLPDGERCDREITLASMAEYYSSLPPEAELIAE